MAILDALFGGGGSKQRDQNVSDIQNIELPSIEEQQIQLQQLVSQGIISPEEASLYLQDPSAMNGITTDPKLQQAQMDALMGLQDISANKGLTAADQAQLGRIKSQEDAQQRGSREAILQNAQARGVGGSGLELLSQMQNQQDSATRQSQRGLDVAAQAQDRALQALQQAGNLGGQMQSTQFGQKAQVAQANDAINQFNTQNKQATGNLNTGARNTAQATNLAEKQRIADANTGLANEQQKHNKGLIQKNYQNQLSKAQTVNQARSAIADAEDKGRSEDKGIVGNVIGGALGVLSDKNLKEDIEHFDPSEFLNSLTSYKYNYKNPKHGEGKQVGVMAQDIEKTEVGDMLVEDTPEGKMVNYNKAGGPIFASLSELNERLKRLEGGSNG